MSKGLTTEQLVLVCCLEDRNAYINMARKGLKVSMFTDQHAKDFSSVVKYWSEYPDAPAVDILSLDITRQNKTRLIDLVNAFHLSSTLHYSSLYAQYLEDLKKTYRERVMKRIVSGVSDYSEKEIHRATQEMISLLGGDGSTVHEMSDIVDAVRDEVMYRQSPEYRNPFRTGLSSYDSLGHMEPGSLLVLGGSSGHGKSTFAKNLMWRWLKRGMKVLLFSFEESEKVVIGRMNCVATGVAWDKAFRTKGRTMSEEEKRAYLEGLEWFRDKPLVIDNSADAIEEMGLLIETERPDVVVVDTINHLIEEDKYFWIKLGTAARRLKKLATKQKCLAVAVAQLKDYVGRPTSKYFLAESKQIVNTADYMDFVYREKEANMLSVRPEMANVLEIYRVKGRLTGIGSAMLYMDEQNARVRSLSKPELEIATGCLHEHIQKLRKAGAA